jgi:hypothetical protein
MTVPTKAQKLAWMRQWRSAAVALERIRVEEVRNADLARIASGLEDACLASVRARGLDSDSGLIAQQRTFMRQRRS